ncbi:MAG: NADH-quinone oxidoreductase subunit C [Acidimicrobiia bacterium]|nr:NADH-quinone oxidoreductase subunit C [Acidimicrobiia bacterium]
MSALESLADAYPDLVFEHVLDPPQSVAHVPADAYLDFVANARAAGFDVFVDLCGVDYLRRDPRFEVVVNLLSYDPPARLRIRVGVAADDPVLPTLTETFPGANFYEREAFDLFGIVFAGHPDLTRIVLPDDWEGHPLRKDYSVGSVPVRFKESPKAQ